jgi:hypothetical protein
VLEFKYHVEFAPLAGCPPAPSRHTQRVGYRFATSSLGEVCNRLPPYKINPTRWIGSRRGLCCSVFALSMYGTRDALIQRARVALLASPQFLKRIGDHYVELTLAPESGRQTTMTPAGHFDLYEYRGFDFMASVQVHEKMSL